MDCGRSARDKWQNNPNKPEKYQQILRKIVESLKRHPSILCWSVKTQYIMRII